MATFSQGEAEGAKPFEAVIRNEEKVMNLETLHAELAITPEVSLRRMTPKLTRPDSLDLESLQVRSMDHAPPVSNFVQ